jgi:Spy/CpxP family protein refolding chaperone
MTMRRFYGHGILAVVAVIGLAALAAAQPPAGGQGMRGQGMGPGMGPGMGMGQGQGMGPGGGPMAALKLTAEQQQQLQALMQTEREAHQAAMAQARELRKQLQETIYGGSGDETAALALASQIAGIEAKARIHMQMAAAAILTPDQRKIVVDTGIEFPPARMGPGGMRGGRGGQPPIKK